MNMLVIGVVGGLAAGLFVARVMVRPAPDTAGTGEAEDEDSPVILRQPTRVIAMIAALNSLFFVVFPFRVFSEPDPDERFILILLMGFLWGLGGAGLVFFLRRFSFSKHGIETLGFPARKMPWKEVSEIETSEGMLGSLLFKDARRRRIAVNATMVGWQDLVRRLPSLCRGAARKKVIAALAKLPQSNPG
jgi:hypothetical protein